MAIYWIIFEADARDCQPKAKGPMQNKKKKKIKKKTKNIAKKEPKEKKDSGSVLLRDA